MTCTILILFEGQDGNLFTVITVVGIVGTVVGTVGTDVVVVGVFVTVVVLGNVLGSVDVVVSIVVAVGGEK